MEMEVNQFQLKLIDVAARIPRGGALEPGNVGKVSTGPQTTILLISFRHKICVRGLVQRTSTLREEEGVSGLRMKTDKGESNGCPLSNNYLHEGIQQTSNT